MRLLVRPLAQALLLYRRTQQCQTSLILTPLPLRRFHPPERFISAPESLFSELLAGLIRPFSDHPSESQSKLTVTTAACVTCMPCCCTLRITLKQHK